MGRYQREKGKRGERILVKHLKELFPEFEEFIERGWQSRVSADEMDVKGIPGIWWENKYSNKPMPLAALRQAVDDPRRSQNLIPIAVSITTRQPKNPVASLRLADLVTLIRHGREVVLHGKELQEKRERDYPGLFGKARKRKTDSGGRDLRGGWTLRARSHRADRRRATSEGAEGQRGWWVLRAAGSRC